MALRLLIYGVLVLAVAAAAPGPFFSDAPPCAPDDYIQIEKCVALVRGVRSATDTTWSSVKNVLRKITFREDIVTATLRSEGERVGLKDLIGNEATLKFLVNVVKTHAYARLACFDKLGGEARFKTKSCLYQTPRGPRCMFFHGVGQYGPEKSLSHYENFRDDGEFDDYWAMVSQYLAHDAPNNKDIAGVEPGFCEPIFFWTNSRQRGWDDAQLQAEYCGAIELLKPDMIYTHSMGNLVVAGGIARGVPGCNRIGLDDNQVFWYGVQGPLKGAPTDAVERICQKGCRQALQEDYDNGSMPIEPGGFFGFGNYLGTCTIVQLALAKTGVCADNKLLPGYASMLYSHVNPRAQYLPNEPFTPQLFCDESRQSATNVPPCKTLTQVASENMKGDLCGHGIRDVSGYLDPERLPQDKDARMIVDAYSKKNSKVSALLTAALQAPFTSQPVFTRTALIFALDLLGKVIGKRWRNQDWYYDPPRHGNDGLVGLTSCLVHPAEGIYRYDPENMFYVGPMNHGQGRCDGIIEDRHLVAPCRWYQSTAGFGRVRKIAYAKLANRTDLVERFTRGSPSDMLGLQSAYDVAKKTNERLGYVRGFPDPFADPDVITKEAFEAIDLSGDGSLDFGEVYRWYDMENGWSSAVLGQPGEEAAKKFFRAHDTNADKKWTFEEFQAWVKLLTKTEGHIIINMPHDFVWVVRRLRQLLLQMKQEATAPEWANSKLAKLVRENNKEEISKMLDPSFSQLERTMDPVDFKFLSKHKDAFLYFYRKVDQSDPYVYKSASELKKENLKALKKQHEPQIGPVVREVPYARLADPLESSSN